VQGGGESLVQLYDRSTSALLRIATKHIGNLTVKVLPSSHIMEITFSKLITGAICELFIVLSIISVLYMTPYLPDYISLTC
jgi:hypothetical protein